MRVSFYFELGEKCFVNVIFNKEFNSFKSDNKLKD